jgi:hypothetical protein
LIFILFHLVNSPITSAQDRRLPKTGQKAAQWSGFHPEAGVRDGKENCALYCGIFRVRSVDGGGIERVGNSEAEAKAKSA